MKTISKTDYMRYLECPLYGWLARHKPELVRGEETLMMRMGHETERVAHGLFKEGVEVKSYYEAGAKETMALVKKGAPVIYQAQAMTDKFLARTDILVKKKDGWHLYEVKSATKVKDKYPHDLKFQANAFRMAGVELKSVNLIYVNNQYVFDKRKGYEPKKLFVAEDMTEEVFEGMDDELKEMEKAYKVLMSAKAPKIPAPKKKFDYPLPPLMHQKYYKDVPDYSLYDLCGRFGQEKINELISKGVWLIKDVPDSLATESQQIRQISLTRKKGKELNKRAIKAELDALTFPLYFLDYETVSTALPLFHGTRPYQQLPMQYSLHILDKPGGELKHYEYLHDKKTPPFKPIAKRLRKEIGDKGAVIVWHESFEKTANRLIGELAPEYANFMEDLNRRIFDLKMIFKNHYDDYRFKGSFSLKAVLPVLIPELSYEGLEIQGGMEASEKIYELVVGRDDKKKLKKQLLKYCDRDTLAMVELYGFLREVMK